MLPKKNKTSVDAHDHVNLGQSSNDIIPSMMNIVLYQQGLSLIQELNQTNQTLKKLVNKYQKVIKLGRTHLMDATPLSLGQEFSAFHYQLTNIQKQINQQLKSLISLALGGTAVGTGLNSHPATLRLMIKLLNQRTNLKFRLSPNKFSSLSSHDDILALSGGLNTLASCLFKLGNDLRFLSSGPRGGIGELVLPANEPGSSIMPGKVNPTQIEALTMVCCQVIGNHQTITLAGASGQLQLNAYKPVILINALQSIKLLTDTLASFNQHCLKNLTPNLTKIKNNLNHSLMIATALNPHLGYNQVKQIVNYALVHNLTLEETVVQHLKLMSLNKFRQIIDVKKMI